MKKTLVLLLLSMCVSPLLAATEDSAREDPVAYLHRKGISGGPWIAFGNTLNNGLNVFAAGGRIFKTWPVGLRLGAGGAAFSSFDSTLTGGNLGAYLAWQFTMGRLTVAPGITPALGILHEYPGKLASSLVPVIDYHLEFEIKLFQRFDLLIFTGYGDYLGASNASQLLFGLGGTLHQF